MCYINNANKTIYFIHNSTYIARQGHVTKRAERLSRLVRAFIQNKDHQNYHRIHAYLYQHHKYTFELGQNIVKGPAFDQHRFNDII